MEKPSNLRYKIAMLYPNRESIVREDLLRLINELEKIPSTKENTAIDLILNSNGGDAYTAYKMLKQLRSKCKSLRVIIPLAAKSAATLLSLGADEIVMGVQSELGPLDAQIEHPIVEGIDLSAMDGVRSIDFLSGFARNMEYGNNRQDYRIL